MLLHLPQQVCCPVNVSLECFRAARRRVASRIRQSQEAVGDAPGLFPLGARSLQDRALLLRAEAIEGSSLERLSYPTARTLEYPARRRAPLHEDIVTGLRELEQCHLQLDHGMHLLRDLIHDFFQGPDQPRQEIELSHSRGQQERQQHGGERQGEAGAQRNL